MPRGVFRPLLFVLSLAPLAASRGPVLAQTTGDIRGTVADTSGLPLPGAAVEIRSPSLQGLRTSVSDASGAYRFPVVPPGTYSLTVRLPGFVTAERTDVRVGLSETVVVPFVLRLARAEAVSVTAEIPAVDTVTTTAGSTYTAGVIARLPLGRNYADVTRLQPGTQEDNGDTQGRSFALSIYGSTSAENRFLIDGVDTTNVFKGIQGKAINPEFVEEVEVKTGGYQAEYGRNTGGVVNVITRQGGNEFHGNLFGYYDGSAMKAQERVDLTPDYSGTGDQRASTQFPEDRRADFGASLGGYVLKDRLWFFAAYDRVTVDRTTKPASGPQAGNELPQGFATDLFSGKLTWKIGPSSDLAASVFGDRQSNDGSLRDVPLGTEPSAYQGVKGLGGIDGTARFTQILRSSGVLEAQYGHHQDRNLLTVSDDIQVTDRTAQYISRTLPTISGGWGLINGSFDNNQSTRDLVRTSSSFFLGRHELKAGGDYTWEKTSGATYASGGTLLQIFPCLPAPATFRCDLTKAPVVPVAAGTIPVFYRHNYLAAPGPDVAVQKEIAFEGKTRLWSLFLQDEWKVLPNLVLNLGLRYDDQSAYKGNGDLAVRLKDQWSPRVGASWDFLGDGSSKLYGSFGRFYYALPSDLQVRLFTPYTVVTSWNYSATSLAQDPTAPRPSSISYGTYAGTPIDPGLKAPYQDEVTFGVEKAFTKDFTVGAKFTYRSLGRTIEDRWDLDAKDPAAQGSSSAIFNPGSTGPAASGQIATCNESENPTDPTAGTCTSPGVPISKVSRIFRGFEILARRRIGDSFWAQASYLYSALKGNYSGAVQTATGQADPGMNADFDYYQFQQNAWGRLELDRPHQFRIDGTFTFPFGLTAAASFYAGSGAPRNVLGWFDSGYTTSLYLVERGSAGRAPTEWDANLAVGWTFPAGPVTITPQLYLFRVFNNQIPTTYVSGFNANGSFVLNPASPYYGQAGIAPGAPGCEGSSVPCTDNPDYGKVSHRTQPRLLRVALRIAF